MKTYQEFAEEHGITLTATRTDSNPNMDDFRGDHWKCVLTNGRQRFTVVFSKGYGHNGAPPTVDEVLCCLASDSSGVEDSFEDWASSLGYDPDSRKAEKTFKVVKRQTEKLQTFLGSGLFEELIYETEE